MSFVEFLEAVARVSDKAIGETIALEGKLTAYIKRLALNTMGNDYAYQFVKRLAVTPVSQATPTSKK